MRRLQDNYIIFKSH